MVVSPAQRGGATTQTILAQDNDGGCVATMQSGSPLVVALEKGKPRTIDPSGKSIVITQKKTKKKKKLVRFPHDDCEFYSNIWDIAATTATESQADKAIQYIDIVQVAHALTMVDYKSDYENSECVAAGANMWASDDLTTTTVVSMVEMPEPDEDSDIKTLDVRRVLSQESNRSIEPPSQYRTLTRLLSMQGGPSVRSLAVPPPTKHDGGTRFIFSNVLSQVELRDQWSSKFLLGLHEPVRHALYVIDRYLERLHSKSKLEEWDTAAFFKWFGEYFCEYVKAQQHIKATVLRPLVLVKYAAKKEIVECYEEITFMLDAIKMRQSLLQTAAEANANATPTPPAVPSSLPRHLQSLQEDIRKLNVVLYHVLNLEERTLRPALISTFNEETFHRFVMPRVFRAARPKKLVIPWIIERSKVWGTEQDVAMFKNQLSFPSRFLYDRVWYPHFARHVVAAMKVLDTTMTEMSATSADDSWLGCSIQ